VASLDSDGDGQLHQAREEKAELGEPKGHPPHQGDGDKRARSIETGNGREDAVFEVWLGE
jgi:hypothetical protein